MRGLRVAALAGLAMLAAGCARLEGRGTIHVIRHFDTPAGVQNAELNARGQARAQALVRWFRGKPLGAIYVTPLSRSQATVAPLAAALGLTPQPYDWQQPQALIARVRAERGAVLIVGHSNTVPDIIARLGGIRPMPLSHPDFGDIWTLRHGETERRRVD